MLRLSRASTSAVRLQRPFGSTLAVGSSNQSDGLFPPSTTPKQDLDRSALPQDALSAAPAGLNALSRRRLPALKGMSPRDGGLSKVLGLQSQTPAVESGAEPTTTVSEKTPTTSSVAEETTSSASASAVPATGLDSFLPARSTTTPPPTSAPSSILSNILNSPTLNPSGPRKNLSMSSPYMPAAAGQTSAWASSLQHQSIFQTPPAPPPTYTLIVNLKVSRNNALATVAYAHDGSIPAGCAQISGGTVGFTKAAQGGFEAGHRVAVTILSAIREENGRRLREKRDHKKVFYRAKAEERRTELVKVFEQLKGEQRRLTAEKEALEIEGPSGAADGVSKLPPASTPNAIAAPEPTTYAAAEPLADTSVARVADGSSTAVSLTVAAAAKSARSFLQRKAAIATAHKSLSESLAAYNASVRLLSSELRDLQANRIPTDALLPRGEPATADVALEAISAELKEAEEQSAGQVGVYFKVMIKGFGQGREAFMSALMGREGHFVRPLCTGLGDASQMKRGGLRPRQPRRV